MGAGRLHIPLMPHAGALAVVRGDPVRFGIAAPAVHVAQQTPQGAYVGVQFDEYAQVETLAYLRDMQSHQALHNKHVGSLAGNDVRIQVGDKTGVVGGVGMVVIRQVFAG